MSFVHGIRIFSTTALAVTVLWFHAAHALSSAERRSGRMGEASELIRKVGPEQYELGNLRIDAEERSIRCPGSINMDRGGPIELLACTKGGKVHESILVLDVEPLRLQLALLLLDLEMGRNPAVEYPEGSPELERRPADTVAIQVSWKETGRKEGKGNEIFRPAHELLYNVKKKRVMQEARWAFIGSRKERGRFAAGVTGSLIVTYHDPYGILELALEEVNSDIWYEANSKVLPPVGTGVELTIRASRKDEN